MRHLKKLAATVALSACAGFAQADYSAIYVFGDSLSDMGNLRAVTQNPAIPERFSNGPVAMEVLAASLGLSLTPSHHLLPPAATGGVYGNNFAIAGAVAIDADGNPATPDTNLPTQINAFLQLHGNQAPDDALYVLMIGGNDIFAARDLLVEGGERPRRAANKRIKAAVKSVEQQLRTLVQAGARTILVINAPDVGATPNTDLAAAAVLADAPSKRDSRVARNLEKITRTLSAGYNGRLSQAVADVEDDTGVDIQEFDLFGFFDEMVDNAQEYGYTNTTEACVYGLTGGGWNPSCDFETFVFFDEIHPTAITHARAAQAVLQLLQARAQ